MARLLGNVSQDKQEKRKKFLFRFLKENGIFTVIKKKFDKDFVQLYLTPSETGGLITNYDDYVNFFVKSILFKKLITYAFEWRCCGWPNDNENDCQNFWMAIADKFENEAKMFDRR